jgi:ribosomal protein S18 acetylase RimI-like enzyme
MVTHGGERRGDRDRRRCDGPDTAAGIARQNEGVLIRAPRPEELGLLGDVEVAAGRAFRDVGMPEIAGDEPIPDEVLGEYLRHGHAWVAVDPADAAGGPAAYLVAEPVDGALHVEQVSVHPRAARRGVGSALLDHAAAAAAREGLAALTLTTFTEVPWNAPYYERLGFRVVPDAELSPGLRAVVEREAAQGLDRWPRVVMRRPL